jgi:ribonuclease-3
VILKSLFRKSKSPRDKELRGFLRLTFAVKPRAHNLYIQALCHKSAARNIHNLPERSNERLEFLGDAVIDVAVADFLYRKYPKAEEGDLTKMKSRFVSRENLNAIAVQAGIHQRIETDQQAASSKESIAGNALEAIVGAIYLDHGYAKAMRSALTIFENYSNLKDLEKTERDFKSRLYEEAHQMKKELLFKTRAVDAEKGTHKFESAAYLDGEPVGRGVGSSKKKAGQRAAQKGLQKLRSDDAKIS